MPESPTCRAVFCLLLATPVSAEVVERDAETSETIIVYGQRHDARLVDGTVATEIIDRAAIERSGAGSVADVLARSSSVSIERSFAGSGVSLLGLDPRYTLVLINGQRTLGQIKSTVDLDRIGVEGIERIEVIRGAASAAYGADGIAGVVNIITRRPESSLTVQARIAAGSDGAWRVGGDATGGIGPVDLSISGGYDDAPAFDLSPEDGAATDGSATQARRVQLRARGRASSRLSLLAEADYQLRGLQGVDASTVAVFDRLKSTESGGGTLGASWSDHDGGHGSAQVRFDLIRDQYLLDQRGAAAEDDAEDTSLMRIGIDARHALISGWHRVTFGVDGALETAESPRLGTDEGQRLRGALFVEDEWTILPEPSLYLSITGGVRADATRDETAISPRIALRFDPDEALTIRSSAGLGFREADFTQRLLRFENPAVGYVVEGDPDLDVERARTMQAGVSWRPYDGIEVYGEGAVAYIDDLIDIAPGETVGDRVRYRYANIASARTVNIEGGLRLRAGPHRLNLGYRFNDAIDVETDTPLEGRARHQAHADVVVGHRPSGLEFDLNGVLVGERPIADGETTRNADLYADLGARVAWSPTAAVTVFTRGENLLDAGTPIDTVLRPRRITAGAIVRL